ncbi:alpha-2-macroglobulin receptor-associated protein [Anabrus simplex]|uniref:alpha-2-macroglobulin receptor-associated protein n=1 Tax=Anabrus simplex TaxID=316456 RepID=UPI0034DD5605
MKVFKKISRSISFNVCYVLIFLSPMSEGLNKYSAEANLKVQLSEPISNFRTLDKPFRMSKINMLWSKAQLRLTEPKLKSLFSELRIHDKEELAWKKLMADGMDKDGLKEAELRKKLIGIMSTYGLLEHFEDVNDPQKNKQHKAFNRASDDYINKSLFKDKKLNKLWEKAEKAGFTAEELQALKEEFGHHQDKIDQYYSILSDVERGAGDSHENSVDLKLEKFNALETAEEPQKDLTHKVNSLREKHREIRDGYDRLHRIAAKGPNSKEFVEPKVEGLWKIAVNANFTPDELESLRVELLHYENRLLKLRHLQAEAALGADRRAQKMAGEKPEGLLLVEENIKKQARKAEKLHLDLETRIMQRHIEL